MNKTLIGSWYIKLKCNFEERANSAPILFQHIITVFPLHLENNFVILIKLLSSWFENNNPVVRTVGFTSHFLSCGGKCFQKRTFGFNNYPIACAGANCTKA